MGYRSPVVPGTLPRLSQSQRSKVHLPGPPTRNNYEQAGLGLTMWSNNDDELVECDSYVDSDGCTTMTRDFNRRFCCTDFSLVQELL